MRLSELQKLLDDNGYTYETRIVSSSIEFYKGKGSSSKTEHGPFWLLTIPNPNHSVGIDFIFKDASDSPELYDMEFGGYCHEYFDWHDEALPQVLLDEIFRIVSEQAYVICAESGCMHFNGIYYNVPDEEMNDMDEFRRCLSKISAPKRFWQKLIGQKKVYKVYSWKTYQKIVR